MSEKKQSIISESTLVPISFLIFIVIGVIRVESTSFKANANEKEIGKLQTTDEHIATELKKHGEALARIEGALGTTPDKK